MTPLSGSNSLRTPPFSSLPRSASRPALQHWKVIGSAIVALAFAAQYGVAQQPSPIPNWTPSSPGTSAGQYSQNGSNQAYGYARQPYDQAQTEQAPAYDPPPDYPQQYSQAPDNQQQYAYQPPADADSGQPWGIPDNGVVQSYQPQQALTPDRLEQMLAPIALYPDNLVSIVLAASTYPAEVSSAAQWLHMQGGAPAEQIAAGANAQSSWDPSIKALTAFPQVLDTMSQNLQWTTDLGNAYYNQPQDVMQTIQVLRGRAQAAGNLQNTQQQEVVVDQGEIQIAPPTPEVVYVPQYNPWVVYGEPLSPYPAYAWAGPSNGVYIGWSPGIYLDAFAALPFGWLGWGLDWYSHAIFYRNDVWCPRGYRGRDWGFAHGGARYWGYHGEMARWRERGWGGRGGWGSRDRWQDHTFRSGLDRGRNRGWGHNGGDDWGNRGGNGHGGRDGGSWGRGGGSGHGGDRNGGDWGRNGGGQGGYGGQNGGSWSHNGGGQGNGGNGGHSGNGGGQGGYGGRTGNGGGQGGYNGGQNSGSWARGGNGQNGGFGRGGNGIPNGGSYARGGAEAHVPNGRSLGFAGSLNGGYGQQGRGSQNWQAYNRAPQAVGRPQQPQQYGGGQSFGQGRQGYGSAPQHVYGGNYGSPYRGGSSGVYNSRPGFGGNYGQQYRSPSSGYGYSGRSYGGSPGIARAPSGGGGFFGGGGGHSSNSYRGGGSFSAPRAPSYSSHSWGGGGGSFSAPRYSGGGGSHSFGGGGGGGHSFGGGGGGSHFSGGGGGHFGGGGGHFGGGGGHSGGGGGHSGGGGGHHR